MFHPILEPCCSVPDKFTYPFCYTPHPLAVQAAERVSAYLAECDELRADADKGKMFGVLVVSSPEGNIGFLAAYSGLLCGRNDIGWFVPPVFDSQNPNGYFKMREAEISALNAEIGRLENHPALVASEENLRRAREEESEIEESFRISMDAAKAERDAKRLAGVTDAEEALLVRESQFMKAELRRIRKKASERLESLENEANVRRNEIADLRSRRKSMSDDLQKWLFSQYVLRNALGEARDINCIFEGFSGPGTVPPGGSGDCCAPKLLQYAYLHGLEPLCMGEFWWGESPKSEVRHHLQWYPSCRSRCLPILTFMMQGLDVEDNPLDTGSEAKVKIIYEDSSMLAVCKPAGVLSVPGKTGMPCVQQILASMRPDLPCLESVHRLDMDTSGVLIFAKTVAAAESLRRQFASRYISKTYLAIVDGVPVTDCGTISLPLIADVEDRPRQKVDFVYGKPSVTEYRVAGVLDGGRALLELYPVTGRTHQLRVHCSHHDGLNCPIVGDRLYGSRTSGPLMLHAASLTVKHPASGADVVIDCPPEW